jgi:hypothetical protein
VTQLVDDALRSRQIRIAHAEVNDIQPRVLCGKLGSIGPIENVKR